MSLGLRSGRSFAAYSHQYNHGVERAFAFRALEHAQRELPRARSDLGRTRGQSADGLVPPVLSPRGGRGSTPRVTILRRPRGAEWPLKASEPRRRDTSMNTNRIRVTMIATASAFAMCASALPAPSQAAFQSYAQTSATKQGKYKGVEQPQQPPSNPQ